jgi:hypothetical protein
MPARRSTSSLDEPSAQAVTVRDRDQQHRPVELPRPDADLLEYPPSYTRGKNGVNPIRQLNLQGFPPPPSPVYRQRSTPARKGRPGT